MCISPTGWKGPRQKGSSILQLQPIITANFSYLAPAAETVPEFSRSVTLDGFKLKMGICGKKRFGPNDLIFYLNGPCGHVKGLICTTRAWPAWSLCLQVRLLWSLSEATLNSGHVQSWERGRRSHRGCTYLVPLAGVAGEDGMDVQLWLPD